jgi:hypothetical protein
LSCDEVICSCQGCLMWPDSWWQLFLAALSGGLTVKLADISYQEWRKRRERSDSVEDLANSHLEPLLKSADEFVGKLRSLAENDFREIHRVVLDENCLSNDDFASILYLLCRFWAQVEIVRQYGISNSMSKDKRGAKVQVFFDCLEGRKVRILPRILQRAVGEVLLKSDRPITFIEFAEGFETNASFKRWVLPVAIFLSRSEHTTERQGLLQYGVIVHAMIDSLDPKHLVTKKRPSIPNKLTEKSWSELNYRIFGVYLKFVKEPQKYIGPPKKAARRELGRRREKTLRSQ